MKKEKKIKRNREKRKKIRGKEKIKKNNINR
jgi:hypothetical protein